ncbi:hypothetical protein E2562_025914 [Oryza meyeriana var. granulata]|uniref:Uncharacterized protein n=1 Tax=Oryza meyeriana var. granulata TaxID=110450 RepID=A0A6G1CIT0_9ORYZ|nr:hypothetical protein E2562_025914 [Oryza meyeriana var. granulata]
MNLRGEAAAASELVAATELLPHPRALSPNSSPPSNDNKEGTAAERAERSAWEGRASPARKREGGKRLASEAKTPTKPSAPTAVSRH